LGFLNAERDRLDFEPIPMDRAIDTVQMARRKFPGSKASLDALCRRFQIDISDRDVHGALKDAKLLAEVYLELIGGRQQGMELAAETTIAATALEKNSRPPRPHAPSPAEEAVHAKFLEKLNQPIWNA
jgi:DNA polymerase-3 subunit epsilon